MLVWFVCLCGCEGCERCIEICVECCVLRSDKILTYHLSRSAVLPEVLSWKETGLPPTQIAYNSSLIEERFLSNFYVKKKKSTAHLLQAVPFYDRELYQNQHGSCDASPVVEHWVHGPSSRKDFVSQLPCVPWTSLSVLKNKPAHPHCITPQPIFSPELPAGWVVKSSGFWCMIIERPMIWERVRDSV